jgi:hypothetical protein
MTKKYLLVEVGGKDCKIKYFVRGNGTNIYAPHCPLAEDNLCDELNGCPLGHTAEETIERRAKGIRKYAEEQIISDTVKTFVKEFAIDFAQDTLNADLEAIDERKN